MRTRSLRDQHGASAVEFAIVLPILLLIVFGIVDFGYAYFLKVSLNSAVREGARTLALGEPEAEAKARTIAAFDAPGDAPLEDVAAVGCSSSDPHGTVTATYIHDYMFVDAVASIIPDASPIAPITTMTSTGVMRCEGL